MADEATNTRTEPSLLQPEQLAVTRLGAPRWPSPLDKRTEHFADETNRVLVCSDLISLRRYEHAGLPPASFDLAGPRAEIYFRRIELRPLPARAVSESW